MSKNKTLVGVGVRISHPEYSDLHLLGKRKSKHANGLWGYPGGHLEVGESIVDCAVRETFEETNLKIDPSHVGIESVHHTYFPEEDKQYIVFICSCRLAPTELTSLRNMEPEKLEVWQWFYKEKYPFDLMPALKNNIELRTPKIYVKDMLNEADNSGE